MSNLIHQSPRKIASEAIALLTEFVGSLGPTGYTDRTIPVALRAAGKLYYLMVAGLGDTDGVCAPIIPPRFDPDVEGWWAIACSGTSLQDKEARLKSLLREARIVLLTAEASAMANPHCRMLPREYLTACVPAIFTSPSSDLRAQAESLIEELQKLENEGRGGRPQANFPEGFEEEVRGIDRLSNACAEKLAERYGMTSTEVKNGKRTVRRRDRDKRSGRIE